MAAQHIKDTKSCRSCQCHFVILPHFSLLLSFWSCILYKTPSCNPPIPML